MSIEVPAPRSPLIDVRRVRGSPGSCGRACPLALQLRLGGVFPLVRGCLRWRQRQGAFEMKDLWA